MTLLNYIQQGGPVMYILVAISSLALAIMMYKLYHFWSLGIWKHNIVTDAIEHLRAGHIKNALSMLERSKRPCAIITKVAIETCLDKTLSGKDISTEIQRQGTLQLRSMESYLRGLSMIAHIAPLLGLLGTVTGMIVAFMALEQSGGQANPGLLAGGIWEALLTTAFGLTIAIPSMAAYYFFEAEVDKVKARMKDATSQVLVVFNQACCQKPKIKQSNISEEVYGF